MNAKAKTCIAGIVLGALLSASPVFGLLGTIIGMRKAFAQLGSSGTADPQTLSANIGSVLTSTYVGLVLCPLGLVLLTVSIVFFIRFRAEPPPKAEPETRF